jgi:excisionase family DNA binding protein
MRQTHSNDAGTQPNLSYVEDGGFELLLDVAEAAKLLRMHPKTLQKKARAGTVPRIRWGKQWMFRASSLDQWVRDQLESDDQSRRVQ